LKFDDKLWEAFKSARDSTNVKDIPIVIVALNAGGSRPTVGQNGVEMHYSGSLLKAAAMYAAYQLHVAVNDLAATPRAVTINEEKKLFKYISSTFDPQIDRAVPLVSQAPRVTREMRIPKYEDIFKATKNGGRWVLNFKDTGADNFAGHLRRMIVGSHNESARFCIRALGYSWINGLLQKAGFFDARTKNGIWLAGDYDENGKWPVVVIPSVNDGKVKQVTTCIDMARLFVLLHDHMLVKDDAPSYRVGDFRRHADMLNLLSDAVDDGAAPSLLKGVRPGFTVLHSKIGIGTLKKAPQGGEVSCKIPDHGCVQSEASILLHPPSGRKFVTVWQNVLWDAPDDGVRRVAAIIEKTMDNYKP